MSDFMIGILIGGGSVLAALVVALEVLALRGLKAVDDER